MSISCEAVVAWIWAACRCHGPPQGYPAQLDSAIGDGDHGANMDRGFQAGLTKLPAVTATDIGTIFKAVMTLVSTEGGAAGPLYGTFFLQLAAATAGKTQLDLPDWGAALR